MEYSIYSVNIRKPPTYITTLTRSEEEIILVHSTVNNIENSDASMLSVSPKSGVRDVSMLDITGSPLKHSFDNSDIIHMSILDCQQSNWLKDEEKHYPLSIAEARQFITDYFKKNSNSKVVWCVCNGQDNDKTVLLAAQQTPQFISRTTVMLDEYIAGAGPGYLTSKLKRLTLNTGVKQKQTSAFYQIFGSSIRDENKDVKSQMKGCVTLEVVKNRAVSEGVHNDFDQTIMRVEVLVGHPDALSSFFWRDLLLLELYINTLSQYRSQEMRSSDWLPTSSKDLPCDSDELPELAARLAHGAGRQVQHHDDLVKDIQKIVSAVQERSTLDVTDQLWSVLVHCSTYGMLLDCLNAFVSEVAHTQSRLHLVEGNNCFMAKLLRGISAGKMAVPTFSGTQPIEILIQLGIEKLRKDYIYVCSFADIADENELNELFKCKTEQASQLPERNAGGARKTMLIMPKIQVVDLERIEQQMQRLGQLETLLEMLLLVPSDWLQYTTGPAFSHFLGPNSPVTSFAALTNGRLHEIQVHLPPSAVQQHVVGTKPASWSHLMESDKPWLKTRTVLHQSVLPIFPPCIHKLDPVIDATMETNELCYYNTSLLNVTNYFVNKNTAKPKVPRESQIHVKRS